MVFINIFDQKTNLEKTFDIRGGRCTCGDRSRSCRRRRKRCSSRSGSIRLQMKERLISVVVVQSEYLTVNCLIDKTYNNLINHAKVV
jgi:hypothetical protein